jgi:hypothetical protein
MNSRGIQECSKPGRPETPEWLKRRDKACLVLFAYPHRARYSITSPHQFDGIVKSINYILSEDYMYDMELYGHGVQ